MSDNKVFVSSTCYDLIDLRAEIKSFLKQNKVLPIMSDELDSEFVVYDTNSIETCLVNLRNCDTVILILSQRYGASLYKAGFGDFSATHLEYLEAVKENKKIICFVRDRLEADYSHYKKTGKTEGLSWIDKKDIKIFEILEQHKKLSNNEKNNWYFLFKNSLDIKTRLSIEFKNNFSQIRLNYLIENDKMPFLNILPKSEFTLKFERINFKIEINNIGNKPAINPNVIVEYDDDFSDEDNLIVEYKEYDTILPLGKGFVYSFNDGHNLDAEKPYEKRYILTVKYKNVYGENIMEVYRLIFTIDNYKYLEEHSQTEKKHFTIREDFELIFKKIE